MAHYFSHVNGQSFTPGSISYPTFQDSSQDPYVLEEAERLLSQFTRSSSPAQRTSSAAVTRGHSTFQPEVAANSRRLSVPNQNGECFPGHASRRSSVNLPPRPPEVPTRPTPPQRPDQTPATFRTRPNYPPFKSPAPSLAKSVTVSNANKNETRQSRPREELLGVHAVNNATSKGDPIMERMRRSRRSRSGPSNYYDNEWYGFPAPISSRTSASSQTDRLSTERASTDRMSLSSVDLPKLSTGDSSSRPARASIQKLLYGRELGRYGCQEQIFQTSSDFKPWKFWIGASNDVVVLAWSPDGTQFAAGAAAESDDHNMEYNRGNNLVVGNLQTNSLKELAAHWECRPPRSGASSSSFNDPRLFKTVTAMQWFDNQLYTASFDKSVKIWSVDPKGAPSCLQTLKHKQRVDVMARSNRAPNILATGAGSFGFWDTRNELFTPLSLDFSASRKNPVLSALEPSALAWGHTSQTNTYLVGGMSERDSDDDETPNHGHLALWKAGEAFMESIQLTCNSQPIFDVKWHPWASEFITASSESQYRARNSGIGRDTQSVMRLYDPTRYKHRINEFPCPALDVNELTFCPMAPNYITASCTDGITYVWDSRNASRILHQLGHGEPLNPIDPNLPRERADVGVRVALWGTRIDQFYSGASDGVIKRWDIRRSSEDVFVEDTITLKEEIMCGAFSGDKSNFLIGDAAGGIHVLSSGPCSDPDNQRFTFERAPEPSSEDDSNSQTGVQVAKKYLSSGQLHMHNIYGAGQGPHYEGPFARWARAPDTRLDQIKQTRLLRKYEIRQFAGPPLENRQGLSDDEKLSIGRQMELARIRNRRSSRHKRKRSYVNLCSDEEDGTAAAYAEPREPKKKAKEKIGPWHSLITNVHEEIDLIDLTVDSDGEMVPRRTTLDDLQDLEGLEDDYWWPESGEIDPNIHDEDV